MGSLETRLRHLEARTGWVDEKVTTSGKVMWLLTDEELRNYVSVLRRMKAGEKPVEEDRPIFSRVGELYEEVRHEPWGTGSKGGLATWRRIVKPTPSRIR